MEKIRDRYYKIVPISHMMLNNKFGNSGEIFKGDKFINLVRSIDEGFCVEATDEELEKAGLSQSSSVEEDDTVDLYSMSKKQLIAFAKENNLTLPDNQKAGKEELVFHIAEQLETEE